MPQFKKYLMERWNKHSHFLIITDIVCSFGVHFVSTEGECSLNSSIFSAVLSIKIYILDSLIQNQHSTSMFSYSNYYLLEQHYVY